jgi:ferrous-iron efflux pump FieF
MSSPAAATSDNGRLMRLATYASISVAVTLILVKFGAWLSTESVSLLATLIDSSLDALASLINLLAVRHALTPADKQHRFGHGKAEALAGLGQATFIAGSAGFLVLQSISRIVHPQAVGMIGVGIGVMVFSILATLGLLAFQRHVIRKTDSTAIKADELHYRTDLMVNGSVIVALVLAEYGWPGFDAVFALGIAAYILYSSWQIAHEAVQHLMDQELPDEDRQRIIDTVLKHPETRGMHDLRTRRSGTTCFIQLHLELDDQLSLVKAHRISDQVEIQLRNLFPDAEIIIHEDPASINEPQPEFSEEIPSP